MQTYDAIVLGVGGVGGATLYELARRGLRVVGIDRFMPPHDRGSSHGQTRVIRQAYFEHPDYVPLLRESYAGWEALEASSGRTLFTRCGLLEAGPADGIVVPGVLRAAELHGLEVESLTGPEVSRRWPGLVIPAGLDAVFEPTAGYLAVDQCVATQVELAQQHGAELLIGCVVTGWDAEPSHLTVHTSQGDLAAARLVIAAGAWARELLPGFGDQLIPLRKSVFWFDAAQTPGASELPTYLFEFGDEVFYGFPSLDGLSLKVAQHTGGQALDNPLDVDRSVNPSEELAMRQFLAQCLPSAGGKLVHHTTCLYTMSPDQHFVVDRLPDEPRVAYAAGLSGHGFKFVPALGQALADLTIDGHTDLPIGFLSATRFAKDAE
jgi:monomeric sarcosine oxidase